MMIHNRRMDQNDNRYWMTCATCKKRIRIGKDAEDGRDPCPSPHMRPNILDPIVRSHDGRTLTRVMCEGTMISGGRSSYADYYDDAIASLKA